MEASSLASRAPRPRPPTGRPELKRGAISYLSNVVIGVASTAPGYSLAATIGFIVAIAGIGGHMPAVIIVSFIPMFCIALGLPEHEPGRSRLRHDVLVDEPGDGRRLGLGRRLGGAVRRHRRQRQPGPDRRHLRLPAVRPQRRREQQVGRDDPRRHLHRRADLDLLAGHRALGAHPAAAARLRDGDADHLRRRGADQGLQRPARRRTPPTSSSTGSTRSRSASSR